MGKVEWGQKRKFIFMTNIKEKKKNMGYVNIKYKNRNSEMVMGVYLLIRIVRVMTELFCSAIVWQTSHVETQ